jgi:hypothetical protein
MTCILTFVVKITVLFKVLVIVQSEVGIANFFFESTNR